ncbi:MAG: hypothetical protein GKR87_09950 [Kiritimatiellae bacterium]|nr:hypothetical protein [Kiritimatiellia bacterium]
MLNIPLEEMKQKLTEVISVSLNESNNRDIIARDIHSFLNNLLESRIDDVVHHKLIMDGWGSVHFQAIKCLSGRFPEFVYSCWGKGQCVKSLKNLAAQEKIDKMSECHEDRE